MANELKFLKLTELSLVDRPANPLAMAPIFKSEEPQEENMTEEINEQENKRPAYKSLYEEALTKSEELTVEIEALKAEVETLKAEAVEKAAPVEYIEVEGEQIAKSDIPAPILKALETAAFEKAEIELEKRASKELPNFEVNVAKALISKGFDEEVMQALKAADKFFEEMMTEKGEASVDDLSDPAEKMDALIKAHMEEHSVGIHKARVAVAQTAQGRELQKAMKG